MIVLFQLIVHDRTILALNHEDGLLDLNALDFVGENRKWIETEPLEVSKTLGVDDSRITVCREIKRLSLDEQSFFQLREQDKTPDRRLGRGHQKPVVAAGIQTSDCRRGEAAQAVGFQPLAAESCIQVAAYFLFELNHDCSCVYRAAVLNRVGQTPSSGQVSC